MATVQACIAAVMEDVQAVKKSDKNTQQGFNFRGIDAVVNAVGPALRKHGVLVLPKVEEFNYGSVEVGKNRTPMGHVTLVVEYQFVGPEGDSLSAKVAGEAMDSGDKATAKAMSVAFRTALLQALALPTDEPDPDASSYERAEVEGLSQPELAGMLQRMTAAETTGELDLLATSLREAKMTDKQRASLVAAYQAAKDRIGG